MTAFQHRFNALLSDTLLTVDEKRGRLRSLWREFQEELLSNPHLTQGDAAQIAIDVAYDLKARLAALESGDPFETKAWGSETTVTRSATTIDFTEVSAYPEVPAYPLLLMPPF